MNHTHSLPSNWAARFAAIWTGQALSLFGSALVQFALVWWLTSTTHSATVLALASLVALLPNVLVAPLAGVLVDRWNRRRVMIVADSLIALLTLGLALLFAAGRVQVWHIYVVMLFRAAAGGFHFTAMQASTTLLVPERHLARVSGFNQALNGGMSIVAPPVGALLLGVLPLQGVLAIDVATALLGVAPLLFVPIPQPPRRGAAGGERPASMGAELREGLRYVWSWPGLLIVIVMACFLNFLLTPAGSLLPILVTQHFGGGVMQLATLESVFGFGIVGGGLLLGVWGGFRRRIFTSMLGVTGIGLGFLLTGLAPASAFALALVGAGVAAVMQAMANGPLMAVLQATVAPEMQGRVFALVGSLATAMAPLGLVIAGPVADLLGVRTWYFIGGGACVAIGLVSFFIPAVMRLEDRAAAAPAAASAPAGEPTAAAAD